MYTNKILSSLVVLSLLVAIWIPLHSKFYTTPAYSDLIASNTEDFLIKLAEKMVRSQTFTKELSSSKDLPPEFLQEVEYIRQTVDLWKVKIFSPEGEIIYSSEPVETGSYTSKDFFKEMMIDGKARTVISEKEDLSSNSKAKKIYIVETYVPINNGSKSVGAFEIYYDITQTHTALRKIKATEEIVLLPIVLGLVFAVLLSAYYANKSMAELKKSKEKFKELSLTDGLTGILNRRGFANLVKKQLLIADRGERYFFLIYIDLDDFKNINDTMGHEVGDRVLRDTAQILSDTFRDSDIIGRVASGVIGRLGGDEFAVLTCQNKTLETEKDIKRRLDENIRLWNQNDSLPYKISLSYGIVAYSPHAPCSFDELMTKADKLMYENKQRRKNGKNEPRQA